MGITPEQFQQMQRRLKPMPTPENKSSGVNDEGELHDDIFDECIRRGWIAFHGSMATRTHRTKGEPDFIILANVPDETMDTVYPGACKAVTFLIECKSRTGKSSTEQLGIQAHAAKLGHKVHVVRSFEEFLSVVGK